ncbi:MAG: energy transducer TonB [Proteobacteria bacterium]|nr:energy transducer TonB [Pseudomonadota bacterium]
MNTTVCSPAAAPRLGAAGVVLAAHGLAAAGLLALSPPAPQAEAPKILQVAWIAEPAAPTPPAPAAPAPTAAPRTPRPQAHADATPAPRPVARPQAAPLQSSRPAATAQSPAPSAPPPAESSPDSRAHESPVPREAAAPAPRSAAPVADSPPRFDADYLSNPAPDYPAASRQLREQGSVQLRVFVTADGRAGDIRVHLGSGFERLDQAAIDAVRRWRFVPARQGDGPVAAWVIVPINFTLRRS